jgi:4-amino-4-deoxy-L-arabinose transferase-like glycosyltransferase
MTGVVIVVLAGVLARCWQIGFNFDADEVFSVRLALLPAGDMVAGALRDTPHPPLHIALLHLWSKLFGASEIAARSLSVALSTAFLTVTWPLLKRYFEPAFALGVLALLSLSPLFVLYGQQARPYALVAFLSSLNLLLFLRFLDAQGNRRAGPLWAASGAGLLYAHYMGVLFIGITALYGMIVAPHKRRALLGYGLLACAAIAPWAWIAMGDALALRRDPLPQLGWITAPAPSDLMWFYVDVFGESAALSAHWLVLVPLAALASVHLIRAIRTRRIPREHLLLLALAFGMPLAVYLVSVFGEKPVFASRQLLGAATAYVLVIGLCCASLPRLPGVLGLWALAVWSAWCIPQVLPKQVKPPWREVQQYVDARYPARTTVVDEWWVGFPFTYYRPAGPVTPLEDYEMLSANEALYLCRTSRCDAILRSAAFAPRAVFVKRWTWTKGGELRLYEIAAAPSRN